MHSVLMRQINKGDPQYELWFRLNGTEVRFSPVEFALMTGLSFGRPTDYSAYVDVSRRSSIRHRYFAGRPTVSYRDLFKVFDDREWVDDDQDAVGIAMLYFIHRGLLGGDLRNTVPEDCFRLVDDIDAVDRFPWGALVWDVTVGSMRERVTYHYEKFAQEQQSGGKKTDGIRQYALMGFPYAFQVNSTFDYCYFWIKN